MCSIWRQTVGLLHGSIPRWTLDEAPRLWNETGPLPLEPVVGNDRLMPFKSDSSDSGRIESGMMKSEGLILSYLIDKGFHSTKIQCVRLGNFSHSWTRALRLDLASFAFIARGRAMLT